MNITKKQIIAYLDNKGFRHSMSGFDYILRAIELGIEDKKHITRGMTKVLYPQIAKEFDTAPTRVERAVRNSIEKSAMCEITNGEFLAKAVDDLVYGGEE